MQKKYLFISHFIHSFSDKSLYRNPARLSKYKHKVIPRLLVAFCTSLFFCSAFATHFEIKQVLIDGVDSIDGLDNPRQVKVSPDGKTVFVTSADDNALLVLEFEEQLAPLALFKNGAEHQYKLEGASGLSIFNNGNSVAVASFYDSAIALFQQTNSDSVEFITAYSDDLDYDKVFKSSEPLTSEDSLGLLGAWDVTVDSGETQLFIASYQSNAIAIFDIGEDSRLVFNNKITTEHTNVGNPGRPVTLAFSQRNKTLVVAGFQDNKLSVFKKDLRGELTLKQTIANTENSIEYLVNPQKIVFSANEQYMYVACSGSNAIVVFEYKNERYQFLQSITHAETSGTGLVGVGSMALSADGSRLFAAGEFDSGLMVFDITNNGFLTFAKMHQSAEYPITGVTSIAISEDGSHLLLTLGKMDALYLLSI